MSIASFPPALRKLINELSKLPTIGEKSAVRLAYHLITKDYKASISLAEAILEARQKTKLCENCFALSEQELCEICCDLKRERNILCVVEKPSDVIAIERSNIYSGLYHVLHGLWSPLRGMSKENTKINQLFQRIQSNLKEETNNITEVVLATSATVEGDATALYIAQVLQEMGIKASRIAQGLPKGGELEYADDLTLHLAMQGRRNF
ncbi:MAG: recombination protein RecR [Proteobacteria bacterium]|nr:recombination protein RecR [Pseudomonadota bacterium]